MKKEKFIIYMTLFIFTVVCTLRIGDVCIRKRQEYLLAYDNMNNRYITGASAPRGRILDVNGKILVDNIGINTLKYNRTEGSSLQKELDIAYSLSKIIKFDEKNFSTSKLKTLYLAKNNNGNHLITDEEWKLYEERKLTKGDISALKNERITDEILSEMTYEDKNASHIYYLLTNGYYYEDKIIKRNLSDQETVDILNLEIPGISVELTWERIYPYGDTLRTVFGNISTSGVPKEYKDYFLKKGINQNSTVGISFLEFEYDDYLRGKDAIYKIDESGKPVLIEPEQQGNDVYLSIDIEMQLKLEEIMKTEMLAAKKARNTEYYNHSFVFIGHPQTGEIVAVAGLLYNRGHFSDITANMIVSSYTVGSIVKGATMSVGYQNNLIQEGKQVLDSCIKVYGVSKKCSWTSLGYIDDIRAMAQSSNYYQFLIATRLTNPNYTWNAKLNASQEHFNIYRTMLASYGLGTKTGIDLPNEQIGIIGKRVSDDLLLNLSIGQYDTYTPIEVFQYINTLANGGKRIAPSLMKKINTKEGVIEREVKILNTVNLSEEKMKRVQKGLNAVMTSGTGRGYSNYNVSCAGKTGTSETFIDTNADGKIDTNTVSTAFIMYAPFENPEYSIAILSPNIGNDTYKYSINSRINRKIVELLFEKS